MRISEFAKELGKSNKEVLDILAGQGVTGKTHSSNISEAEANAVKAALAPPKAAAKPVQKPAAAAGQGAPAAAKNAAAGQSQGAPAAVKSAAGQSQGAPAAVKSAAAGQGQGAPASGAADGKPAAVSGGAQNAPQGAAPKKKLIAVYRPQNAETMKGARPGQNQGRRDGMRPQGGSAPTGMRPQGQGGNAPTGMRPQGQGGNAPTGMRPQGSGAPAGMRPQGGVPNGSRPQGPAGMRPQGGGAPAGMRPQGQGGMMQQGSRPQGMPAGSAAARPQGAPAGQTAARPQGAPAGQTAARPQGAPAGPASARPQGTPVRPQTQTAAPAGPAAEMNVSAAEVRPQEKPVSAAQGNVRPQGSAGAPAEEARAQGQSVSAGRETARSQGASGQQPAPRDGVRPQSGRDSGRAQGSYAGNRDGRSQGGSYAERDGGSRGQGGYGNREGNRDGGRGQGSFGGSYGSRDGGSRGQGGYGSRDGSRDGGSRGQGGFGSREGSRDGGSRGQGGFGGRDGRSDGRGGQGGRSGGRDGGKSFDTPIATKPQSNRAQKNAHKNDRYDNKKSMNEDGPRTKGKSTTNKHPFIMPQKPAEAKVEDTIKVITIPESLTIKDLAEKMKLQPSAIVKKLFLKGTIVTLNQEIDYDQAEEIAMEYDVLCEKEEKEDVIGNLLREDEESEDDMVARPPVVCVMGHVDHGKTSLLDAIRQTNVTSHEAGGITQHIGAYTVEIRGQKITFLDTPGHEAFTAMRMRGAQSTDIAVLVVAADDGVMPQTVEAINHAKAAGVEIIVAVNKIDKPSANVERVKQEMTEYQLIPEDWGGSTIFVPVSAHTKEGIPELLEMILLTAEVKELKANPNRNARGLVIEAQLDKGKGPVATMLVQKGTLRVGDNVAVGACYGKVRAMMDDKGRRVKEALPSTPVEILGLNGVPGAGEIFVSCDSEKEARSFAETFISEGKNKLIEDTKAKLSLDDLFSQIQAGNVKELPIIVKADVQGSVEAVTQSLTKLSNEEVVVKVIHGGVGAINESDVTLASASNAIIIGFNVRPDATAKSIAEQEKVDIRLYRVIYQAIEDVEAAMKGMLDPVFEEQVIGHAVVRQTFKASGVGTIAGSYVLDGKLQRGCSVRITRNGEKLYEGPLASLKRFKDDVKEVATGYECGLSFEKFNDVQEDDMIEAYAMVEVPR